MTSDTAIRGFFGEHRWLSNFWPAPTTGLNGLAYPTAEHAFQACKFPTGSDSHERVRTAATPADAKRLGRQLPGLRPDWNALRLDVMLRILRAKFAQHPGLASRLKATGAAELVEANTWGDRFWGVCDGRGENHLGKLLMRVRDELTGQG